MLNFEIMHLAIDVNRTVCMLLSVFVMKPHVCSCAPLEALGLVLDGASVQRHVLGRDDL